jgi:DNA polymerase-1
MSKNEKKLFLLDAMALIYRAHFAFSKNPRINSKGQNTGAVLGFTNSLLEILNKENPSHIAVAFDTHAPTFRHEKYEDYKAQRQETPEDILFATPKVKELVKAFNIPVLELDGYEADDIIGTLAKKAAKCGYTVYMMTPDKDYAQLVEEKIFLYKPAYMGNAVDILGIPEVLKKFDIENVDQVRDILGLQGDSVDNIPGIPGVGAKTAVKFLKEFGSIENLVKNTDKLKGKQKERVEEFGKQGILSKELATINTEVPIDFNEKDLEYTDFDEEALKNIFGELEFRTVAKRVFGTAEKIVRPEDSQLSMFDSGAKSDEESPVEEIEPDKRNLFNTVHTYHLVDSVSEVERLAKYLGKQPSFCFDTEIHH